MTAGLSLRELIHEYKHQTLVLFKCCLLQPKVQPRRTDLLYDGLTSSDALLRVSLRTIMHGPIRSDITDSRSFTEVGRLRGPRFRQLREEPGHANIAENQRSEFLYAHNLY